MEIDYRTPREAIIYEIGRQAGIIKKEQERQYSDTSKRQSISEQAIKRLQREIDFKIELIRGL